MCYLIAFEHVCSAFTLVRRHRQPRDSGSCCEDLVFAIFNSYVPWVGPFYTPPARLRLEPPDPESRVRVPPVSGHFFLLSFVSPHCSGVYILNSTQVNEKVFNRILRRGCKAVGPGGPDSISLWLFQAFVSHFNSGKPILLHTK